MTKDAKTLRKLSALGMIAIALERVEWFLRDLNYYLLLNEDAWLGVAVSDVDLAEGWLHQAEEAAS